MWWIVTFILQGVMQLPESCPLCVQVEACPGNTVFIAKFLGQRLEWFLMEHIARLSWVGFVFRLSGKMWVWARVLVVNGILWGWSWAAFFCQSFRTSLLLKFNSSVVSWRSLQQLVCKWCKVARGIWPKEWVVWHSFIYPWATLSRVHNLHHEVLDGKLKCLCNYGQESFVSNFAPLEVCEWFMSFLLSWIGFCSIKTHAR